jgi:hypothetical protein
MMRVVLGFIFLDALVCCCSADRIRLPVVGTTSSVGPKEAANPAPLQQSASWSDVFDVLLIPSARAVEQSDLSKPFPTFDVDPHPKVTPKVQPQQSSGNSSSTKSKGSRRCSVRLNKGSPSTFSNECPYTVRVRLSDDGPCKNYGCLTSEIGSNKTTGVSPGSNPHWCWCTGNGCDPPKGGSVDCD